MPTDRPILFYDGGCPLCRREIAHYRRLDRADRVQWLDIAAQPERLQQFGIPWSAAMSRIHLREADGGLKTGAYAFQALWSRLPYYRWLARLVAIPGALVVLDGAYNRFARWRWRRRGDDCGCNDDYDDY